MKVALIEAFYGGSHKAWAKGFQSHLDFNTCIFSLKDAYWKWRMHGGAVTLAKEYNNADFDADLILATDMLDLSTFLSLTRQKSMNLPAAIYFHENQLAYPWQEGDRDAKDGRDLHYAFINYSSALCADRVYFNSEYNMNSFLEGLELMLRFYPDHRNLDSIKSIRNKSELLPLGLDLKRFDAFERKQNKVPSILWNHRWEHDKNPEEFFDSLIELKEEGLEFELIILGERYATVPEVFEKAKEVLKEEIIQFGYAQSFDEYAQWLKRSDILPVTSNQDFFGISVVEAVYCGAFPVLPNRLAFPELFEKSFSLYEPGAFKDRLREAIKGFAGLKQQFDAKDLVRFDWSSLRHTYHQSLSALNH